MTEQVTTVIQPFVQHGLFESPEKAITEIARYYISRQIESYQSIVKALQAKYAMNYEQFDAYLAARAASLASTPNIELNQAIMEEEDDALDWKIARDMLISWLGLQVEVGL